MGQVVQPGLISAAKMGQSSVADGREESLARKALFTTNQARPGTGPARWKQRPSRRATALGPAFGALHGRLWLRLRDHRVPEDHADEETGHDDQAQQTT